MAKSASQPDPSEVERLRREHDEVAAEVDPGSSSTEQAPPEPRPEDPNPSPADPEVVE